MREFFKNRLFETEIVVLILTILFYIFRQSIPFFKYPFLVLYFYLIVVIMIKYRGRIIAGLKDFLRNYYLILFLTIIYILSLALSNKLFLSIFKDVFNGIVILSLFLISSFYLTKKNQLKYAVDLLLKFTILFSIIISIYGFCILLDIFQGLQIYPLYGNFSESIPVIEIDNNFGILPIILGVLAVLFFLRTDRSLLEIRFSNFLLMLFSISIFLSGSRRGVFTLILIICLLFLIQIIKVPSLKQVFGKLASNTRYLHVFLVTFFLLSICIIFFTPNRFKNKTLETIGSKNILNSKIKITAVFLKYSLVFNKSISFVSLYNRIWTPEFDSFDPESSWGTTNHKTVFPLTGKGVEIIPKGAKGYLLDSTCNSYFQSTYSDSFSLLTELIAVKGERYKASIYCFVSDEFDGDIVRLSVAASHINDTLVSGSPVALYDLNSKGVWRNLEINLICNTEKVPIYISLVKYGVKDFSKLKGYVIFAYPKIEKCTDTKYVSSHENLHIPALNKENSRSVSQNKINNINFLSLHTSLNEQFFRNFNLQNDIIRNYLNRIIVEDTAYQPYKNILVVDSSVVHFGEERIRRWIFAIKIFAKEYSWRQQIFGGGFKFLNWYGYYFMNDKTTCDTPHNPFLSILLYSGIIGLLIYCYFIYKAFLYYIRYRREYPLLFIFFLIIFLFTFISGGSPFDPPIFGFFSILPFFIDTIHKKKEKTLIESQLMDNASSEDKEK